MPFFWVAIILGLVQGLTEFLPVSSSGHLMLFAELFNADGATLLFDIILHVATLIAICVVFRKKIWTLARDPFCKTNWCLLIATVVSCAIVLIFNDLIEKVFSPKALPFTFLLTAVILLVPSFVRERENGKQVTYLTACVAGLAQGVSACFPGLSRSGSTISATLAMGTNRKESAEFSFLMSIPVILASLLYEIVRHPHDLASIEIVPTIFAFVVAVAVGIFAIKVMLKIVQNVKLYWFSVYLGVLAVVTFILFWFVFD